MAWEEVNRKALSGDPLRHSIKAIKSTPRSRTVQLSKNCYLSVPLNGAIFSCLPVIPLLIYKLILRVCDPMSKKTKKIEKNLIATFSVVFNVL